MKKYRKLIVAGIGVGILAAKDIWGIELGVTADQIVMVIIPLLTALGVWGVRNEE